MKRPAAATQKQRPFGLCLPPVAKKPAAAAPSAASQSRTQSQSRRGTQVSADKKKEAHKEKRRRIQAKYRCKQAVAQGRQYTPRPKEWRKFYTAELQKVSARNDEACKVAKDIAVEARCIATEGWEWAYQAKDMVERCDVRSQQCYDTVMAMSRNCKNENVRLTALEASHKDNQIMIAEQSRNLIRMQRHIDVSTMDEQRSSLCVQEH